MSKTWLLAQLLLLLNSPARWNLKTRLSIAERLDLIQPVSMTHMGQPSVQCGDWDPSSSLRSDNNPYEERWQKRKIALLLGFVSTVLLSVAAISAVLLIRSKTSSVASEAAVKKPTLAISKTCSRTRYPSLCIDSLVSFPGAMRASEQDLVRLSVNLTLQRFSQALYGASSIATIPMGTLARIAYDDCIELLEDSTDQLANTVATIVEGGSGDDVLTWLSAVATNQDTCLEVLADVGHPWKGEIVEKLRDLSELMSNSLGIFANEYRKGSFTGIPIHNRRKLLTTSRPELPSWVSNRQRWLIDVPATALQADMVVDSTGNGTHKRIKDAIKDVPEHSSRRTIIFIKSGWYHENVKVGRKKTNVVLIGEGMNTTIITGDRSVLDNYTTFHTATFAATGDGFFARDITFRNTAGPSKHQAVALRIGADRSVVYRCNVQGYQDTLYVHSQRQFYRECLIYGTVDFIFGNAAVVFQNCSIYVRKPLPQQKNTVTAQNRKDPNQNTGISIHNCQLLATNDLEASKVNYSTYLGRPWKTFSRVVYMLSYIGDHVHPAGWLEWNSTSPVHLLYYGEYHNHGPGAVLVRRVNWTGFHVIGSAEEANRFTVANFIYGSSWLPSTGVAYVAGLTI